MSHESSISSPRFTSSSCTAFATPHHFSQRSGSVKILRRRTTTVASSHPKTEHSLNICSTTSRRSLLISTAAIAAAALVPSTTCHAQTSDTQFFALPDLPYPYDGLQPRISEQIMRAHHDAHFATYVKNLNKALNALPQSLQPAQADDVALRRLLAQLQQVQDTSIRTMIRNNAGGYLNHKQFFSQMSPKPSPLPSGALAAQIDSDFGSFDAFKKQFLSAATTLFGSGFVWLVLDANTRHLRITKYANQDNPALDGDANIALLGCDCWEHAWYYQYGPKKADYINAWWELVHWPSVAALYRS